MTTTRQDMTLNNSELQTITDEASVQEVKKIATPIKKQTFLGVDMYHSSSEARNSGKLTFQEITNPTAEVLKEFLKNANQGKWDRYDSLKKLKDATEDEAYQYLYLEVDWDHSSPLQIEDIVKIYPEPTNFMSEQDYAFNKYTASDYTVEAYAKLYAKEGGFINPFYSIYKNQTEVTNTFIFGLFDKNKRATLPDEKENTSSLKTFSEDELFDKNTVKEMLKFYR